MLDKLVTITVSQRPVASVLALVAISVLAFVALSGCDAAAEHRPMTAMQPMALMSAPSPVAASAPAAAQGGAALHAYREDADPSHAAIASYRD